MGGGNIPLRAPGGQSGYRLHIMRFDGGGSLPAVELGSGAVSYQDATGGAARCYVLEALQGASSLGKSEALCAVPGADAIPV